MNSNITYAGKVSIKIKGRPRGRVSNNGTYVLLDFIGDCLINAFSGNFLEFTKRSPAYIDILLLSSSSDTEGITEETLSNYPTAYTRSIEITDNNKTVIVEPLRNSSVLRAPILIENKKRDRLEKSKYSQAIYTALVNTSNINISLIDQEASTTRDLAVCLVDAQQQNVLAFAKLDIDTIKSLTSDIFGQATLQWTMEIGNKEVQ